MALEESNPASTPDRFAACVQAVDRYLRDQGEALLRAARKSLIFAAHEAVEPEDEDGLIAAVEEVEAVAPEASDAFRTAILARLATPEEGPSEEPAGDGSALTVVDTGKVDDWLRMREIVERHGEAAATLEIDLDRRLAAAAGVAPHPDNAPVSVPGMCRQFHAVMRNVSAGSEARAAIFDAFEGSVIRGLGELVQTLIDVLHGRIPPEDAVRSDRDQGDAAEESRPVTAPPRFDPPPTARSETDAATPADDPAVEPARLLGAIVAVERQMHDMAPGHGMDALVGLEARLAAALTPPGADLDELDQHAVGAVASLVHQAFAHPGIAPDVRTRLWKLAPALALLALQDDGQLDLALQATRHDPITGLLDRSAFRARLDTALGNADRGGRGFAVCLLGVDGFDDLGRRLGPVVAGRLLRALAALIKRRAGTASMVARLRGADFAILLPARHHDTGWRFANRVLSDVQRAQFAAEGHSFIPAVSAGVVESDDALVSASEVMRAADAALRSAQEDGGGCARVHIPEDGG